MKAKTKTHAPRMVEVEERELHRLRERARLYDHVVDLCEKRVRRLTAALNALSKHSADVDIVGTKP